MPWIIDVDCIPDHSAAEGTNANAKGVMGPWDYKGDGSELTHKFRMLDDDDEVYYEGRSSEVSFNPLEDFGTPNAGCTSIQYWRAGRGGGWETL